MSIDVDVMDERLLQQVNLCGHSKIGGVFNLIP